jgi:Domain of unknown function (DUF4282)
VVTEQTSGRERPDDLSRGGYVAGGQYLGAVIANPQRTRPGRTGPGPERRAASIRLSAPRQAATPKAFLSALFDFNCTSFVTTKIIKVLYVLIMIVTCLSALMFTVSSFKLNAMLGFLVLVIGDPLFILIVMGFWRLILEVFIIFCRGAADTRTRRGRKETR